MVLYRFGVFFRQLILSSYCLVLLCFVLVALLNFFGICRQMLGLFAVGKVFVYYICLQVIIFGFWQPFKIMNFFYCK